MSKSSKGNSEKHGKKVAQKAGLNRSSLDQGWRLFATMLTISKTGGVGQCLAFHHILPAKLAPVAIMSLKKTG
jgi:putative transposase